VAWLGRGDSTERPAEEPVDPVPVAAPIEAAVSATGPWTPGETVTLAVPRTRAVSVRQCITPDGEPTSIWRSCDIYTGGHYEEEMFTGGIFSRSARLSADGLIEFEIPVYRRLVLGDRSTHDCVTDGPCELILVPWTGDDSYAPIPIDFVAGVDPIGDPRIAVDRASELVHEQPVTVTVTNIALAHTLDIQLCPRNTPTTVTCETLARRSLDGTDGTTLVVSIPRSVPDPLTGELHDCADQCALRATTGRIAADITVAFAAGSTAP